MTTRADAGAAGLYGLILAGGKSRRMGRDKALLRRHDKSQLAFAVELVAQFTERYFVSTRKEQSQDAERSRYPQIVDRFDDLGPVAGILSAMREFPDADWLVVACDLPNLDAPTLSHLVEQRAAAAPFVAYRSSYDNLPEPLCAIYRQDSVPIVEAFVEAGLRCPRKILLKSDTLLLKQPNPSALDNVNTPEDLADSVLVASAK